MQTDALHSQQDFAVRGIPSVSPVSAPASPAAPENQGSGLFGPAYVRENQRQEMETFPQYRADATLPDETGSSADEDLADARALRSLEARDREVRRKEEAKGEAVGSRSYIYQTGPDGKRYATGTAAHTVRQEDENSSPAAATAPDGKELSREDEALLQKLQARDTKVRGHEAAHVMAAGGQAQGLPTYTYQTGPDGRRYAVGGSVNISMLRTGDAEHDARQANRAYRAAMATGEPSARDMQTASMARNNAQEASQRDREAALSAYAAQSPFQVF
ncbi:hypothetical protein LJC23_04215 [Desulfovibrio sp. OttesenSCG-928-I05]|nr:hypothetical protein [Desulfovibrio sp. OttesenSCG-928-I05]